MDVIGCTPITLQQTHSNELFELLNKLRKDEENLLGRYEEVNL